MTLIADAIEVDHTGEHIVVAEVARTVEVEAEVAAMAVQIVAVIDVATVARRVLYGLALQDHLITHARPINLVRTINIRAPKTSDRRWTREKTMFRGKSLPLALVLVLAPDRDQEITRIGVIHARVHRIVPKIITQLAHQFTIKQTCLKFSLKVSTILLVRMCPLITMTLVTVALKAKVIEKRSRLESPHLVRLLAKLCAQLMSS